MAENLQRLTLIGGPLHRFGCRVGLIRGGTNSVAFGLVLGVALWSVLIGLATVEGHLDQVLSISTIGAHVRLLLVIPLFFVCETLIAAKPGAFVPTIVDSQVVPASELPALDAIIARVNRLKDSWLAEVVFLLLAVLSPLVSSSMHLPGATSAYDSGRAGGEVVLTGVWYWAVCMTVFRFLLLRWMWRLALWTWFLWRLSRLRLRLLASHADAAGGIGNLEIVHLQFAPLLMAISAVFAAAFAEEIAAGNMTLNAVYPSLGLIFVVDAVLFLGPLYLFVGQLAASRARALHDYVVFAARYVSDFEDKWMGPGADRRMSPLGSEDLEPLGALSGVVQGVRGMRLVVISPSLLITYGLAAALPMVPLWLFRYPVAELASVLFGILFGM
jgi:hypothetical protein